jgi:hypothetical protein
MQHVADNRPAGLALAGLLTENPVLINRVDGAVAALELNPGIEKPGKFLIASGHRVSQENTLPRSPRKIPAKAPAKNPIRILLEELTSVMPHPFLTQGTVE